MANLDPLTQDFVAEGSCGCAHSTVVSAAVNNFLDTVKGDDAVYGRMNVHQREAYIELISVMATVRAAQMGLVK